MKKSLLVALGLSMVLALTACGKTQEEPKAEENVEATQDTTDASAEDTADVAEDTADVADEAEADDSIMSYADYVAAELDSEVKVECYVQATQSWWEDAITVYAADEDGAYFIYNMACSEEDAAKLVEGTKIVVTGYKSEWSGEVEIVDGTFESDFSTGYVATATDATALLGTDELADYMNQKVSFTDMTVTAVSYKNNEPGDDIYVNLEKDGVEYYFCLEYYLNGSDADFYELVGNLQEGQVVDVEAFLYWYEGPNPHLTAVTVK